MTKRFVPKNYSEVDLKDYGGEGKITLRPKTKLMDSKLAQHLAKRSKDCGIEFSDENEQIITAMFSHDLAIFTLLQCIVTPEGEEPILEEELMEYPDELINDMLNIISGDEAFPLAESGGEETKTAQ